MTPDDRDVLVAVTWIVLVGILAAVGTYWSGR